MIIKKLKLPVSGRFPTQNKWLSMDDYVKFVNFCASHFPRARMTKKEWLAMHAGVPFSIK